MNKYVEEKRYRGKVQAIILDWSGTTADAYVVAPSGCFCLKSLNVKMLKFLWPKLVVPWVCEKTFTLKH